MIIYNEEIDALSINLFKMFAFYFSEKFYHNPPLSNIRGEIESTEKKNLLIFIDKNLDLHDNVTYQDLLFLSGKRTLLQSNTFTLINLKAEQKTESFNYLVEKYLDQVNIYSEYSTQCIELYDECCLVKSEQFKAFLQLQEVIFSEHLQEIKKHFFTPPKINWSKDAFKLPYENIDKLKNSIENKPRLRDVILIGNAFKIEVALVKVFKKANFIDICRMFTALEKLGYIKTNYGEREHLILCLNNSIGSEKYNSKSVFFKTIDVMNDKKYIDLRNRIIKLLEEIN
jgi:hypothetical protein